MGANQITLANGMTHVGPSWAAMETACSLNLPRDWKTLLRSSCLSVAGKDGSLSQSLSLAFPSPFLHSAVALAPGLLAELEQNRESGLSGEKRAIKTDRVTENRYLGRLRLAGNKNKSRPSLYV